MRPETKTTVLSGAVGGSLITGLNSVITAPDSIKTIVGAIEGPQEQTVQGFQYGPYGLESIGPITVHTPAPTVGPETVIGTLSPVVTLALWSYVAWQLGIPQYVAERTKLAFRNVRSKFNGRRGQGPDNGPATRIGLATKAVSTEKARRA